MTRGAFNTLQHALVRLHSLAFPLGAAPKETACVSQRAPTTPYFNSAAQAQEHDPVRSRRTSEAASQGVNVADSQSSSQEAEHEEGLSAGLILDVILDGVRDEVFHLEEDLQQTAKLTAVSTSSQATRFYYSSFWTLHPADFD